MANRQDGLKGNPASKRMQNANLKARRARSWARGQRRKALRREAQAARQAFNDTLRAAGIPLYGALGKAMRRAHFGN